jgi:DNA-binding protein YbaB
MAHDNYYQKDEVLDNALEVYLFNAENKAKEYIDKKLDNTTDDFTKRLNSLGFK